MSHENSDLETSWNLCVSALEPEPSSSILAYASVNVASGRPVA